MRILVIWGESLSKSGAGTAHAVGLVSQLARQGHAVTTLAPWYKGLPLGGEGIEVTPIRLGRRGWLSFLRLQAITLLAMPFWLRRYSPDAVYVRTCFFQGLMAVTCRIARRPLVAEVDSLVDLEIRQRGQPRWLAWLVRMAETINCRWVSGLVCVTRGLRRESIARGASEQTTVAIHNGARTDVMVPGDRLAARRKLHLPDDAVVIGFVGTYAVWQGLDFLIEAADIVRGRGRIDVRVALMGGGALEADLRGWISQRGLQETVSLHAPGDAAAVAEFFAACDGSVLPIHDADRLRHGSSALKFWDALSCGLPVLTPRGADLDDVLEDVGVPGLFDPADPASLAGAMIALADEVQTHRSRRDDVHRRVAAKYGWDSVARQVAAFLEELRSRK